MSDSGKRIFTIVISFLIVIIIMAVKFTAGNVVARIFNGILPFG